MKPKLLSSKKASDADAFEFGNQLPSFLVLFTWIIILITVLITALSFMKSHQVVVPEETYYYTYISRFLYSKNCFLYYDLESGYSSGLVIDYNLFTENRLNSCFVTDEKSTYGFRLRLISDGLDEKIIATKNYFNKPKTNTEFPVIIYSSGQLYKGKIAVDIVSY